MRYSMTKAIYPLVALLLFAACSQEEIMDDNALPEGMYPLQIASVSLTADVSEQPWGTKVQTRVSESKDGNSSVWSDGDVISVQIGDKGTPGTYVLDANGSINAEKSRYAYWESTASSQTITAWYTSPNYTDGNTVNLADQSNGLAYVLKATDTKDFNTGAKLSFTHQLAKVRVVAQDGDQADDVNEIKIKSYTSCSNNQGTVADGTSEGWITMHQTTYNGGKCWEANVVPGYTITEFQINNKTKGALSGTGITPEAATVNTIGLQVGTKEINLDTYEGTTLTVRGKTTIKGNEQQKNLQVTVEPNTELTLQGVNLSYKGSAPVVFKGNATLILEGVNTLEGICDVGDYGSGSGIYIEQGTLTINADNENASLTINRKYNIEPNSSAGMGIYVTKNASLIIKNGKITIKDVESEGDGSGAGIGSQDETCGNITIEGGNITVGKCSWYAAGIGSLYGDCKGITITGENTVVNVSKGDYASCYIGSGSGTVTGNITIGGGATVNGVKYSKTHTGPL